MAACKSSEREREGEEGWARAVDACRSVCVRYEARTTE